MPFDRAGARAAGWSDAEIDSYLSNKQASAPDTTSTQGVNPLVPIATGAAGLGLLGAGTMGAMKLGPAAGRVAMEVGSHLPLIGPPIRTAMAGKAIADRLRQIGQPAAAAAEATAAPAPAPAAAPRPSASVAYVTEADIAKHPELKSYEPGQEISRKTLDQIKTGTFQPAKGSAQSRVSPTTVKAEGPAGLPGQEKTDMRPGYTAAGNKQRGASARTLASRQAQMEGKPVPGSAAARTAAQFEPPPGVIVGPGAGTPEEAAAARSAWLAERQAARASLGRLGGRVLGGPELQLLMMLLGAPRTMQDVEEQERLVPRPAPPQGQPRGA